MLREALDIRLDAYGETHELTTDVKRALGSCLTALAHYDKAESLLLDSYAFYKNEQEQDELQEALEALIDLYTAWGKPVLATAVKQEPSARFTSAVNGLASP